MCICKNYKSLNNSFNKLKNKYDDLIFENYIGKRSCNIGNKAIGAIELKPKREFYDYHAKYKKSSKTQHIMPANISKKKYSEVLKISKKLTKF